MRNRASLWAAERVSVLRVLSWTLFILFASVAIGTVLVHPGLLRLTVLVALLPAVAAIGIQAPSRLVYGLAMWLVALGLIRRLFDTAAPVSNGGLGDPLLLFGPAIMIILFISAVQQGAFRARTPLANAVLVLTVLTTVEAVNPLQGGVLVGIGGWLFLLVPILAFWVGRSLVDDRLLQRLLTLIVTVGVGAVIYGSSSTVAYPVGIKLG
jgi:hypothetical protein